MRAAIARGMRLAIAGWVALMSRRALPVVLAALASAWLAFDYASTHLGVHTNTADMIASDLPWRERYIAFKDTFPGTVDNLLVVVDGPGPEQTEAAADALARALGEERALVEWAQRQWSGPFFDTHGLLYLDLDELDALALRLARAQPLIAAVGGDRSLRGLADLLEQAAAHPGDAASESLARLLGELATAADSTLDGAPRPVSWEALLRDADTGPARRIVVVKPRLDYSSLLPAGPVIERIREVATELGLDASRGVSVRVTGGTAMEYEEMVSVSRGGAVAAVGALVAVLAVLVLGLRSARLVAASLATLLVGLMWTAAFAAFAVGHLNLISIAFAVLYVGLGIDYAVHFGLRYRELVASGHEHEPALRHAASDVGLSLVLCAVTTGIAFYAFVPTDFAGVSELGIISGTGMFISLFANLTVLPALLGLAPLGRGAVAPLGPAAGADAPGWQPGRGVIAASAVLLAIALAGAGRTSFDGNPINLRDAEGEAVATYLDLLADAPNAPWPMAIVADAATARAVHREAGSMDAVESVVSMLTFVPGEQDEKLARLEELDLVLSLDLLDPEPPDLTPGERREALVRLERAARALAAATETATATATATTTAAGAGTGMMTGAAARALAERLAPLVSAADEARSERFERAAVGGLAGALERLGDALAAGPVALGDLPESVTRDWRSGSGALRIELLPAEDISAPPARDRFVAAVLERFPEATGTPLVHQASAEVVVGAFAQAFIWALVLIAGLLVVLLGRMSDVALVLGPLLVGAVMTVGLLGWLGVDFNYANVIVLPLLLGMGVDSGVHMVHRHRSAPPRAAGLLRTSTARAVLVSALTSIASFGNLAFSAHPGTASMGTVLVVGLALMLICTLGLLPAILSLRGAAT